MMGRDDWFRRSTWTEQDRADFATRLKRSRTTYHKSQYLRIQACHLQDVGTEPMLRAALELINQLVNDFPDPTQLSSALHQRAQCLADLGNYDAAIASYRQSFEACRNAPQWQNLAYLDFGELTLGLKKREMYADALAVLDEFGGAEVFPDSIFRAAAIRALIADDQGDMIVAREFAQRALSAASANESPFRYHRKLGLVRFVDPEVIRRLRELAARGQV